MLGEKSLKFWSLVKRKETDRRNLFKILEEILLDREGHVCKGPEGGMILVCSRNRKHPGLAGVL